MTSFRGGEMSVIEGRDGWLFIGTFEGVDALAVYTDECAIPESDYRTWAATLSRRRERFAQAGIVYLSLVVPDSCLVYPEKLPEGMTLASPTPYERLANLLDEPTGDQCVYPLAQLIAGRQEQDTFQSTDSHWTDWGAYLGYRAAMEKLAGWIPNPFILEPERLAWSTRRSFGALGAVMTPERSELVRWAQIRDDPTRRVSHVRTHIRDGYTVIEQDRPDLPTAVVFRDSAMTAASKFFAQSFRRIVFVSSPNTVLYDLVDRECPDVVIHEFGERRMVNAPDEPTTRDFRAVFGDLLLDDEKAVADQRRAQSLLESGKAEEALAASDSALATAAPNARQMIFRGRAYRALGETDAELEVLRHATLLDPQDSFAHFALGQALRLSRRPAPALAAYERAIEIEGRQLVYWSQAIATAIEAGAPARAEQLTKLALAHFPDRPELHYADSCALAALGRLEEAEPAARRAVRLAPQVELFGRQLASVLVRRESWAEARQLLLELLRSAPDQAELRAALTHVQRHLAAPA